MRQTLAIFGVLMAIGSATADDVTWKAAVPLWKSLANGRVVAAGPAPAWLSEKIDPAATLAPPRPAPIGLPRPLELPDTLTISRPILTPVIPAKSTLPTPVKRSKEAFANVRVDGPTLPAPKPHQ